MVGVPHALPQFRQKGVEGGKTELAEWFRVASLFSSPPLVSTALPSRGIKISTKHYQPSISLFLSVFLHLYFSLFLTLPPSPPHSGYLARCGASRNSWRFRDFPSLQQEVFYLCWWHWLRSLTSCLLYKRPDRSAKGDQTQVMKTSAVICDLFFASNFKPKNNFAGLILNQDPFLESWKMKTFHNQGDQSRLIKYSPDLNFLIQTFKTVVNHEISLRISEIPYWISGNSPRVDSVTYFSLFLLNLGISLFPVSRNSRSFPSFLIQ